MIGVASSYGDKGRDACRGCVKGSVSVLRCRGNKTSALLSDFPEDNSMLNYWFGY